MKRIQIGLIVCTAVLIALGLYGCGGVDEAKPLDQVKAEAEKMDVEQLKAVATKYKAAIEAKKDEIAEYMTKLKEIPATEQLGNEASALKDDLSKLNDSMKALQDRFQIYYNKLKELGGNI
ncbi:MAG: hypothetical protein JW806_03895 [Sedimentisphaerales bacterium]|nr:hypothetical protein [Sedimentisphaerales bacterium]